MMTLLKFDNELLMLLVSSSRGPVEPESLRRSDPAKSTRFKMPVLDSLVIEFFPLIFSINTECDREDRSLQFVEATARFFLASFNRESMFCSLVTSCILIFV